MLRKSTFSLLFLILFVLQAGTLLAKPAPPPALTDILSDFGEVEELYEEGKWSAADAAMVEIRGKYSVVHKQHADLIGKTLDHRFDLAYNNLKQVFVLKNEELAQNRFVNFRFVVFDIMELFDYTVHPIFAIMQKYIDDEAREALGKGEFDEVADEVEEVHAFFIKVIGMLKKHDIASSDIDRFLTSLKQAMAQAGEKDVAGLETSLDSIHNQLVAFEKAFH